MQQATCIWQPNRQGVWFSALALMATAANTSLPPLPTKIVQKIVELKYVEMSPARDMPSADRQQSALRLVPHLRRRKGPVAASGVSALPLWLVS